MKKTSIFTLAIIFLIFSIILVTGLENTTEQDNLKTCGLDSEIEKQGLFYVGFEWPSLVTWDSDFIEPYLSQDYVNRDIKLVFENGDELCSSLNFHLTN